MASSAPAVVAPVLTAIGSMIFLTAFTNLLFPPAIQANVAQSNPLPLIVTTWANPGFPEATDEGKNRKQQPEAAEASKSGSRFQPGTLYKMAGIVSMH